MFLRSSALLIPLLLILSLSHAQEKKVKRQGALYFLDSVRVTYERGNTDKEQLSTADVAYASVIKDRDSLRKMRLSGYDSAIFIFTKGYLQRPAELRSIPVSRQLIRFGNQYYYKGKEYTGKVIDYYFSGKVKYRGTFEKGKKTGTHFYYTKAGAVTRQIYSYRGFKEEMTGFDSADRIMAKHVRKKDKPVLVEFYYPNGQVKDRTVYLQNGTVSTAYYSSGKLKDSTVLRNRTTVTSPSLRNFQQLLWANNFTKALELDPKNPEIFARRSYLKADSLAFDAALLDIDTCLALEPYETAYYGDRAFIRIRKYAYLSGKDTLRPEKIAGYLTAHPNMQIPPDERKKIIKDLQIANSFGYAGDYEEVYEYFRTNMPAR